MIFSRKEQMCDQKLKFNVTFYLAFKNLTSTMEELHILLTPNEEHKKLVAGFRNDKSQKEYLVRAILPKPNERGRCRPCEKKLIQFVIL